MSSDIQELVDPLRRLHERLRDRVVAACEEAAAQPGRESLSQVHREGAEDTIYAIDRLVEEELLAGLKKLAEASGPLVLIAEGLPDGSAVLPPGASPKELRWRLIVDPIDGSRGLMHQKRSAWILTGAAPDRGHATT
ncbi:MAG: inositol monophosphatase, partial [Gemmatimonadetes bacterium]|nr:inositol monophosphatase [Gemmatimonadota bacterium]